MHRYMGKPALPNQPQAPTLGPDHLADRSSLRLIGTQQVAELLNMSVVHVRRLSRTGKIPPGRAIGLRKLYWRLSDIEALINAEPQIKHSTK
jgi:predicted DNA-binding transcriptional regulator AlpA